MDRQKYKYIFGPVPSRRFGRSLGVDLTPFKTCDYDCIFCQLGPTESTTVARKDYVPIDEVIEELRDWLENDGEADFVTLSGSGEPTLHKHFGKVFEFIKSHSDIRTLLLTNSSMLSIPEARADAAKADIVKVSLSAWSQESMEWINRPHPTLRFEDIVAGLKQFRKEYDGELRMEVFLVAGLNSTPEDATRIAALADEIEPDLIQLNTAVRPPAEDIGAVSCEEMERLAGIFNQKTEVIANFKATANKEFEANEDTILAMLKRRPCTAKHIAQVFGMHLNEVAKYTGQLLRNGDIRTEQKGQETYYVAKG